MLQGKGKTMPKKETSPRPLRPVKGTRKNEPKQKRTRRKKKEVLARTLKGTRKNEPKQKWERQTKDVKSKRQNEYPEEYRLRGKAREHAEKSSRPHPESYLEVQP